MDKNKNRTDLLAAGRKKLQQFRQKKDSKGSSSHGTSSKKSSKSEQVEYDAGTAASTPRSTGSVQAVEEETLSRVESSSGGVNTLENPVPFGVDVVSTEASSDPVEPGGIEARPDDDPGRVMREVVFDRNVIDSSDTNEAEGAKIDDVTIAAPLGVSDIPDFQRETKHDDSYVQVEVPTSDAAVEIEQFAASADREILSKEGVEESLPSHNDTPNISMVDIRGDQVTDEADGLGLEQYKRSCDVEAEDQQLNLSLHSSSVNTIERSTSVQPVVEDVSSQWEQTDGATEADNASNVTLTSSLDASKVEQTLDVCEMTNQWGGVVDVGPSEAFKESKEQYAPEVSALDVYGNDREDGHKVDIMDAKESNEQYRPEDSFIFVGKSAESSNSSEGSPHVGGAINLTQLIEVIKGLGEDEFRSLVGSRISVSKENVGTDDKILWERIREELYISNCDKNIFLLQLAEQSGLQIEYDHKFDQLNDELLLMQASLKQADERSDYLAAVLAECRSELQVTASEREEFQIQVLAAKAEVEKVSVRADELQNSLEVSQSHCSSLSKESTELKEFVAALQLENETLKAILGSQSDERNRLAEERDSFLHENEKLLKEIADCNNLMVALQEKNSFLSESLAFANEEKKKFDEEKESHANASDKLLAELADIKDQVDALQAENLILSQSLTLVTEEKKKLEEAKDYFVSENEKISLEFPALHERLSKEHEECMRLEVELKDVTMRLDELTEKNKLLNRSLDMHVASHEGTSGKQDEKLFPDNVHHAGTTDAESGYSENKDGEGTFSSLEKSLSGAIAGGKVIQSVFDDSLGLVHLKRHLEDGGNILQKLEFAVERMHSHSVAMSSSGGKVAAPAVSKLIQAFETKVHYDEQEAEERVSAEDASPSADAFAVAKEHTENLKAIINQLVVDVGNANLAFKAERDGRSDVDLAVKQLKSQLEALREHSDSSEAKNIEVEILYEVAKHHLSGVIEKSNELKVLCDSLNQQNIRLKAENSELGKKLDQWKSRNNDLENQLNDLQQSKDNLASRLHDHLENFQKEASEKALAVEVERNSTSAQIVGAVEKLDNTTGILLSSPILTGDLSFRDICNHVAASVDAAVKMINDLKVKLEASQADSGATSSLLNAVNEKNIELKEKLEVALTENETSSGLFTEANEKCNDLLRKNELANDTLLKLYYALWKLVTDSCGSLEESAVNIQRDELDSVEYSSYATLVEKLDIFLSERMQLLSLNNKLNMELLMAAADIEELNRRSLDLTSIQKLNDYIESVLKLEDAHMGLDEMPVSRLEALVSLLAEKYKEAEKLVSLSREEFGLKETELTELQEKLHHLEELKIQQENENPIKESQAEEVSALQSQLQKKINELGQSEQRLSSIREKLSIAVAKGKGLIAQRDTLKQSLAETSSELERCSQELQLKDARLQELEAKQNTYSEAGERVEALESELSYIRNSATALRESFLLKDSVLQRIEEILEDLELPEHFHSRGIIEKVEWLARTATGNSVPPTDWDQKSSVGGSFSDAGFVVMDAWKEDAANPNSGDDLRRKFEELQNKFYGLAEQNEMLEQSLMERNQLIQRWEELLDRINIPSHMRTLEPEDRIGWLGSALSEANDSKYSLLQKIDELENYCGSLVAQLEDSQKRMSELNAELELSQEKISGLEAELQAVIHEKEAITERLKTLTVDYEELSDRVVQSELDKENLRNEVAGLREKLVEKLGTDDQLRIIDGEISRLQNVICDALQDPESKKLIGGNSVECLEQLLRKLIENSSVTTVKPGLEDAIKEQHPEGAEAIPIEEKTSHTLDSSEAEAVLLKRETVDVGEPNVEYMRKQLEDTLSDLMTVRKERDRYMVEQQSLVVEMESLNKHRAELQELLKQEEQKSTSAREKLNVAIRKGKSLVQQRDSLKQTIEELTSELERLKSEAKRQEDFLVDYEQKMRDLTVSSERVEALQSECESLRNQLAETDRYWEEKGHALSIILSTLQDIDVGGEFYGSDPIEKLEFIGKQWRDFHSSISSLEQESRKSRRAAELLLAELNEVQERNDSFQEELAKFNFELAELSKQRELAESARLEAVSRLEEQSIIQSEQKKKQYSELLALKSTADLLRESFLNISKLVNGIFTEDLEFMQNLVGVIEAYSKRTGANTVVRVPTFNGTEGVSFLNSEKKGNFLSSFFSSESHTPDHIDDMFTSEVSSSLQEITKQVGAFKITLRENSVRLHEQASKISKLMGNLYAEITSQDESSEVMGRKIKELESIIREKESETIVLRRNCTLLHEACCSSLMEIQNSKARVVENASPDNIHVLNFKSASITDVGFSSGEENIFLSEESVKSMAERLLLDVKNLAVLKDEILEDDKKEMKITISNLQKELHEKDNQREKISMELVAQIKEAEAAVSRYSSELQSSQALVHDLEKQAKMMIEERNFMEQSLKKLQDEQVMITELEERISLFTGTLAAKDQEIEALMQALDEEEVQMEELTHKVQELEKVVEQKNSEIVSVETSRAKVLKKLSTTVNKFDELHQFSESVLGEVEKLQSQLQDRDTEISFLRQEVTRCTSDALVASQMSSKSNTEAMHELLASLITLVSPTEMEDVNLDDNSQLHDYKEILQKKITSVLSELANLRVVAQSKDEMLQVEKSKVEELTHREEALQRSLHEKESHLNVRDDVGESEILEVEPLINKWVAPVPSSTSQVRNLRKVNNDQVAIAVDIDEASSSRLEDEDDDKVHGFKSLTASKVVPKFTRPVTDVVDGLWVSCDRTLMRQPTLRLGIMIYWALLHALLAAFVF